MFPVIDTFATHIDSLALNIPILTNLKHLTIESVSSSEFHGILDLLPQNPIPFYVTVVLEGEALLSVTEQNEWSKLMDRITSRRRDEHKFYFEIIETSSNINEGWVVKMKKIFGEELGGYMVDVRVLEVGTEDTEKVIRLRDC